MNILKLASRGRNACGSMRQVRYHVNKFFSLFNSYLENVNITSSLVCFVLIQFCIDARPVTAELQPDIHEQMEKEVYKPRRHPGVMKPRWISLPEHLVKGIRKCLDGKS